MDCICTSECCVWDTRPLKQVSDFPPAMRCAHQSLPALPLLWLRPGQRKLLLPRRRLLFNVVSAMPRLEVELQGMPKDMYQGEVVACTALLRNRGSLALRNLQLVLSGPQVSASDSVDCCWQRLRYGCKCRKCGCLQTSGHADVVNEQIQQ